ncbi:hypothetical protein VVMO6_03140 [Vibrio vulnificus MO6-24/O]|nr:hypothetical protein VVMO6_03140 [Vibrio vulnificus MO6-24/O]
MALRKLDQNLNSFFYLLAHFLPHYFYSIYFHYLKFHF